MKTSPVKLLSNFFLNKTKENIYIKNCEIIGEFEKQNLEEEHPFIENAVEAILIKSREPNTTAVLLTFNLHEQPYNIFIPGEPSDTAVYEYQNQQIICHKCYKYGHSKAHYKRKRLCRNCWKS